MRLQKKLHHAGAHTRFLRHLNIVIPPVATPIIVANAGLKVPFHREVEALGWRSVGRVWGRDFVRLTSHSWTSRKRLFKRPTALSEGDWVRTDPVCAECPRDVADAGRLDPLRRVAPKRLVLLYAQCVTIEQLFRDVKYLHIGEGLGHSHSHGTERFTVLVLIASLAAYLLRLIGTAAEHAGANRRLHPGNGKRRMCPRPFLARPSLDLASTRDVLDPMATAIAPPAHSVASDRDALLADGASGG